VNKVIGEHDFEDESLFIYYPMQSVHYPVEVPKKYSDKFTWVKDETRRTYFGMVSAMDESIGKIVDKLTQVGQLENTLIIFTSDNGGRHDVGGINYPLRGEKATIWQGGVRSAGFITGPGIPKNSSSDQLFHVTDWLPTVLSLVGCENKQDPKEQDGVDQTRNLKNVENVKNVENTENGEKSDILRSEILININPLHRSKIVDKRSWINTKFDIRQKAALVQGKWKIMTGTESSNTVYRPPEMDQTKLEKQNDNKVRFQAEPKKVDQSNQTVFLFDLDTDESESVDVSDQNKDLVNSID
jgi:arylsulfatase B/arylsulfatase I/J